MRSAGDPRSESTPICLREKAKRSKSRDARATLVRNYGQAQMGDRGEFQPQLLVLKSRTLRAEGVLLHEHLAVGAAVIRGDLHAHLLRALLPTLLHLVDEAGDLLGLIELEHDSLGRISPGSRPTCATLARVPVDQVLDGMGRVLG